MSNNQPSYKSSPTANLPFATVPPFQHKKTNTGLILGIVGGVIGLIVIISLISSATTIRTTTVQINMTLSDVDCSNISWGYFDIPGAAVVLTMDGEQVGVANYSSYGTDTYLGCKFTAYMSDVPTNGDIYTVALLSGRRGSISNDRSTLENSDWVIDLSLG